MRSFGECDVYFNSNNTNKKSRNLEKFVLTGDSDSQEYMQVKPKMQKFSFLDLMVLILYNRTKTLNLL